MTAQLETPNPSVANPPNLEQSTGKTCKMVRQPPFTQLRFLMERAYQSAKPADQRVLQTYLAEQDYGNAAAKMSHLIGLRYGVSVTEAFTFFNKQRLRTIEFLSTMHEINVLKPKCFSLSDTIKQNIQTMVEDPIVKKKLAKRSQAKLGDSIAFYVTVALGLIMLSATLFLIAAAFAGPGAGVPLTSIEMGMKVALCSALATLIGGIVKFEFGSYIKHVDTQLDQVLDQYALATRSKYQITLIERKQQQLQQQQQQLQQQQHQVMDIVNHYFTKEARALFEKALMAKNVRECHGLLRKTKPRLPSKTTMLIPPTNAIGWFFGDNRINSEVFEALRGRVEPLPPVEQKENSLYDDVSEESYRTGLLATQINGKPEQVPVSGTVSDAHAVTSKVNALFDASLATMT